jgi:hypothetical protein
VEHLLLGHLDEHLFPGGHLGQLLGVEPFLPGVLEGELGEQVLTHQPVLQLTGLDEQPDELLAVLDSQRRLDRQARLLASRVGWPDADATPWTHLIEPAARTVTPAT